MTDAPERIWAQDAQPDECDYTGGGWWDDECGNTQYPHIVEYIRADLARPMTVAEAARRLIDEINRPATHEEKPDWRYLSRLDMTSLHALSHN